MLHISKAFESYLLRQTNISAAQAEAFRAESASFAEALRQSGLMSDEQLWRAMADFCELPFRVVDKEVLDPALTRQIPARFATHYAFVPVAATDTVVTVAVSDPMNTALLDDIRLVLKKRIEVVVAPPGAIQRALKTLYGVGADTVEQLLSQEDRPEHRIDLSRADLQANLGDASADPSIVKFVNELLLEAVHSEATDIHLEPFENRMRVRFRIDGLLHEMPVPASIHGLHAAIVSRIKVMAQMDISEKRLPQDGKFLAALGEEKYDIRVSILPTPYGETVNMRLLSRSSMFLTLEQLGLFAEDMSTFNALISKPHGMLLVTGPTGSGKTTTLYAALSKVNRLDCKILTIEDPIEYQLDGVTQMQIQPQIGFDFAAGLRSMLRHDPDIMLVGEIRDYETAEMAIRSSLTGHLVLSTLHTNDAVGAVTRLVDMGVEPFLISSTLLGSVAQRLVRRICPDCATPYTPDPALLAAEFGMEDVEGTFFQAQGCESCRQTGYKGRIAIYEILPFTSELKALVGHQVTSEELRHCAMAQGMRSLRAAGWRRVCEGITTLDEVLRATTEVEVGTPVDGNDHAAV